MAIGFVLDAYTDYQDPQTVREICDAAADAAKDPYKPRPEGECVVSEITRQ